MKREDLENLGLNEEQITGVMKLKSSSISENDKELESLKTQITQLTTEKDNLQNQIADANKQIEDFKSMDIESIKKTADEYKTKYEESEKTYKQELAKIERSNQVKDYFSNVDFASESAKQGVIAQFNAKDFKFEDGKFLGADEWLNDLKQKDAGAFIDKSAPKFTTDPSAPKQDSSDDELRKAFGLE